MQHRRGTTYALLVLLLAAAMLVSACGGNGGGNGGANNEAQPQAGPETEQAANDSGAKQQQEQSEPESATRVISTVNGDVEIPVNPQRIVALYYHHILLALDMKPVGANLTWWGGSPFLQEQEQGIEDVGGPVSLEAVAKLNPDLIILNDGTADLYDQLEKIAPSVLIPYDGARSAYEDARLVADVVGAPQAADQLKERFEQKAAEARAKLAGVVDEQAKAVIIRIEGQGAQFAIFGDNYGRGGWSIYRGLGFRMPDQVVKDVVDSGTQIVQQLSMERLPEYAGDADYIFVSLEGEGTDLVADSGIWKTLPAVKNNKVIELDSAQYFYFDPISIEGQLGLITDLLLASN